ncbi:MAG: hypothetical protein KAU99_02545 [Thermoplasmata archaeon]|nr:hypothetical protein [Thermoplasmata archaeon]
MGKKSSKKTSKKTTAKKATAKKSSVKKATPKRTAAKKTQKVPKKSQRKPQVERAAAKISKAETALKKLRRMDAETKDMVNRLSDAKFHFKNKDYRKSISLCNKAMKMGELSKHVKESRDLALEAADEAKKLKRLKYDMSETFEILSATEVALADSNFKAFKSLLSEAKKSMDQVKRSKKLKKELEKTKASVEDLKAKGAITLESEILLSEAEEALKLKDLRKAGDFVKAVKKWIDIEALERERQELLVAQDEREVSKRLTSLPPEIQEFHKLGIDTSAMEDYLAKAQEALDEGDHVAAKRNVLELDEILRSLRRSSLRAARETIDRAREKIEEARMQNVGVLVAERSLGQAEKAFVRGEYRDTIDFAQLAMTFVKRSLGRMAVQRSAAESDADYTDALITIGRMVSERVKAPEEAPELPSEGSEIVDDSLADLESTYMTLRAQEDLESIRSVIDETDKKETGVSEAKIMLRKAQDAFKIENYAAVTVLERTVRDLLIDEKAKKSKGAT